MRLTFQKNEIITLSQSTLVTGSLGKMGTETAHCGNEGTEENDLYTTVGKIHS